MWKSKTRGLVGVTAMSLAMGACLAAPAYAQTTSAVSFALYVSTTGSNTTGQGTITAPYQTISYAISEATPGSTIIVEPGVYKESLSIDKQLTIESDPSEPSATQSTILDATGQNDGIDVSGSASAGTVITGLTIEHANNKAIWAQDSAHLLIANNFITDNGLAPNTAIPENKPIQLDGVSYSVISNNTITNNQADGAISVTDNGAMNPGSPMQAPPSGNSGSAAPAIVPIPAIGNVISDNTITGNLNGCAIVTGAFNPGGGLFDTQVIGNTVSGSPLGIDIGTGFIPGTQAIDNSIVDNTVTNNLGTGILVHSTNKGDTLSGSIVSGNTVSGNGPFIDRGVTVIGKPTGIALIGDNAPVTETTVTNNTISNEYYGIWGANAIGTTLAGNAHEAGVTTTVYGVNTGVPVLLNNTLAAQLPMINNNGTTYVAIWYVMQMMNTFGVQSSWNGHTWAITSPVTPSSILSAYVGAGPIKITLNQMPIGQASPLYAPNSSGHVTTYLPMKDIADIVTSLGVQNVWNGVTWTLTDTAIS
ncbi:MAG: right-handed parallel beta-helix repeat-containing protein [Firmicutes bacterium]|nr:right-handed parallel beta-helix repeat-containing protein [Bacillota bacterium]